MYKKASDLYLEFKSMRDSLYNIEKDEKIEQIKVQYETEKKEKALLKEKAENERLEKEKALADIRVYNRNKWIIGISSVGLIIIFFLLFISQRNKRKSQAEKDAAIIEERERGMKAIFEAQEEERKRIAKDLHDGIGQQVSAIKMFFQSLSKSFLNDKPEFKDDVEKISHMITEAGTDVRTISHQMMPRALTELGLVAALEDMIDKSFSKSEINCKFEHYNISDRLPQHVEIGLYRITQELLNNIIKHSGALRVDVQLMKVKNHCVLIVQDDGKGLDDKDKSDGIGMMNITNRLRSLNGEMNMESALGQGTTATIRIALE
jgi:signal transduction histidine kinase